MNEEKICILGKEPKVFSYIEDGKYVHTVCKLKDDIDCFKLREFFNMVYRIKLDIWDINFVNNHYSTADLIKIFRMVLEEKNYINLKDLCSLIGNNDNTNCRPLIAVIGSFFDLFETIDESYIYLNNSNDIKVFTINSDEMFYKEVESIFYNSKVIDSICNRNLLKIRKQS